MSTPATVLTLNILAEDINNTSYLDTKNCAISRAFVRAGRPDLFDSGAICSYNNPSLFIHSQKNLSYRALLFGVLGMYGTRYDLNYTACGGETVPRLPIEDFEITLTFNE